MDNKQTLFAVIAVIAVIGIIYFVLKKDSIGLVVKIKDKLNIL